VTTAGEKIPVLLTGIGGGGHGEQILKALRLGKRHYSIVGTDISERCANAPAVDVFHVVPPARDNRYLDVILDLARRYRVRALFHGSEAEMVALGQAHATFAREGIYLPVNPPELLAVCQDKTRTMAFLHTAGFAAPRFREVRTIEDATSFGTLPAILKPAVGGGGSANVFIAQSEPELEVFARFLLTVSPSVTIQEYIGTSDHEYTVGVLFGADGALINSIAVRRLFNTALSVRIRVQNRTPRAELGPTLLVSSGVSQGVIGRWPDVTAQCERIAAALKPTAPVNIQCRLVDGRVFPFEINPRFSGTTSLRAMVGYNEPDVLIRRDVLGEPIEPRFDYRSAVIMRGLREQETGPA
jgi:carbamoyl-phosphate synthase large subunit